MGIPPSLALLGVAAVLCLTLALLGGTNGLSNLVCFAVPLKGTKDAAEKADMEKTKILLVYWVFLCLILTLESITSFLNDNIFFFPFLKAGLFVYCFVDDWPLQKALSVVVKPSPKADKASVSKTVTEDLKNLEK